MYIMVRALGHKTLTVQEDVYNLLKEYKFENRLDSLGAAIEHAIKKAKDRIENVSD